MKKRIIGLTIILILAGTIGITVFKKYLKEKESPELTLYGNVDIRQVNLSFLVPGKVKKMYFDEGDIVKQGQVVAKLDAQPYLDNVAVAKADLQTVKANLLKFKNGSRPQEIKSAIAQVKELEAAYQNAVQLYERQSNVINTGAVSLQNFDDTQSLVKEAKEKLKSAKEQLNLLKEGFRYEDVLQAEAQVKQAKAKLESVQTDLKDTQITAPNEGTILTRIQEPGAVVAMGSPVYTLSLKTPLWVRTYINEPRLGEIHPGMKAEVFSDSRPDKPYHGHVGFISPVAEFTPKTVQTTTLRTDLVYRLRIVVDDPDEVLKQGMPVTVKIKLVNKNVIFKNNANYEKNNN